jgi:tRNA modification GTPase
MQNQDTITAIATASGVGAIAIIRLSGDKSIKIADKIFVSKNKKLAKQEPNTIHYGFIKDGDKDIDDVLVSIFKAPHSYTGEDAVEISCHGSIHIQQKILELLIHKGARLANPGEFTQRAFLNRKMDLSQAEAVADLIASSSESAHKLAIQQMRGGFSNEIQLLRSRLLHFISLIELELDFSEEDVEFANRNELKNLISEIEKHINELRNSFSLGNAIKNGIPVTIIGEPNVGKSTLLNAILKEEKAIVSEIAGTTRDAIEDVISINGILFRFIDTAGIRESVDTIENLGIERTYQKIEKAEIILYLFDITTVDSWMKEIDKLLQKYPDKKWIFVANKVDKIRGLEIPDIENINGIKKINVSAKHNLNIDNLINTIIEVSNTGKISESGTIITNTRHFEALTRVSEAVERVISGLQTNISSDFLAQDIRQILHYLGEISGEITNDEILGNIFKNFCIGK